MSEGAVIRAKFRPARGLLASVRPESRAPGERPLRRTNAARLARQLALAHWIERAVEVGRVGSYGEAARALGLTESRVTQITALLGLSPSAQEAILLGVSELGIREALRAAREVEWGSGRSPVRHPGTLDAPPVAYQGSNHQVTGIILVP